MRCVGSRRARGLRLFPVRGAFAPCDREGETMLKSVGSIGGIMACSFLFLVGTPESGAADGADLVVRNAQVLTVDAARPRASAFAIKGGMFVAVGNDEDVTPLVGANTRRLDLAGK